SACPAAYNPPTQLEIARWTGFQYPFLEGPARPCRSVKGVRNMSSTMMVERTGVSYPGTAMPGYGTPTPSMPMGVPAAPSYLMVPRCTLKFEKCSGGMKVMCSTDDKTACSMMQNLCSMLAGGMCSCYATWNGVSVCCCYLTMGQCKCEATD